MIVVRKPLSLIMFTLLLSDSPTVTTTLKTWVLCIEGKESTRPLRLLKIVPYVAAKMLWKAVVKRPPSIRQASDLDRPRKNGDLQAIGARGSPWTLCSMTKSIKEQASRPRYSTPWASTLLKGKNISDSCD